MADNLTIALNTEVLAPSQYMNYPFDAVTVFNGQVIAAGPGGIYQLDSGGTDDGEPIDSRIDCRNTDFGMLNQKRFRKIHFGYESDGELLVKLKNDDGNERAYHVVPAFAGKAQNSGVVTIGRDGKGRYWQVRIENVDGADFSVDSIDAVVVVLHGKPSGS